MIYDTRLVPQQPYYLQNFYSLGLYAHMVFHFLISRLREARVLYHLPLTNFFAHLPHPLALVIENSQSFRRLGVAEPPRYFGPGTTATARKSDRSLIFR